MKDESELISKLMEETMGENISSSFSEPLSTHDLLNLQDSLFQAFPIQIYQSFMRIFFNHGPAIDIPRGLGFFHNEEQVFSHMGDYPSFEMDIIDDTFQEVVSDHLFVKINKAIIFKHQDKTHIVFYNNKYEERVWTHIQDLNMPKRLKAA